MRDMSSTSFNPIRCSRNNPTVHLACSCGGFEHVASSSCASTSPVIFRAAPLPGRGLSLNAACKPSNASRRHVADTVTSQTSNRLQISVCVSNFGLLRSANSSIRARVITRALCSPPRTICFNALRSLSLSRASACFVIPQASRISSFLTNFVYIALVRRKCLRCWVHFSKGERQLAWPQPQCAPAGSAGRKRPCSDTKPWADCQRSQDWRRCVTAG